MIQNGVLLPTGVESFISAACSEDQYRTVNWGKFRRARADGDYADYGREIQIEDYRIG